MPKKVADEILDGRHGGPGDQFLTVRQLAKRFDIALATAQKVVNHLKAKGQLVADSTRRVKIGPAAIGGPKSGSASGFSPRRLGLVVTDITNPFFGCVCRDVQQAADDYSYQVLMASSESDFHRERNAIEGFLEIGVEGLLICPGLDDACTALYQRLIAQGIRLSFVSRRPEGVEADFVVAHNFAGGALVAGHLLSMNYESFGYIGFGPRLKRDERLQGFRSALLGEGATLQSDQIVGGNGRGIAHGYRAMGELMQNSERSRAVFAFNDLLAIGSLHFCQDHDIAVPDDVAIVGFDNLPESRVTSPPLTSVVYPIQSIARLAVQNLVDRIQSSEHRPSNRVFLEPHLVIRKSTDPEAKLPTASQSSEVQT